MYRREISAVMAESSGLIFFLALEVSFLFLSLIDKRSVVWQPGFGVVQLVDCHGEKYENDHDDYNVIMVKAVADRLAEAFAELMHQRIRKDHWGYDPNETLSNEELIKETYNGIRPAPGYPACPDHTEKEVLFELINATSETGIKLTDDLGFARVYFTVIGDQIDKQNIMAGLQSASSYIKRELSRRLRIRRIPDLKFEFDESLQEGYRVDELLRKSKGE